MYYIPDEEFSQISNHLKSPNTLDYVSYYSDFKDEETKTTTTKKK